MSVIRGLDEVYNSMVEKFEIDSSPSERAKRKLLTGTTSSVLSYSEAIKTQRDMFLYSRFSLVSNHHGFNVKVPVLRFKGRKFQLSDCFILINDMTYSDACNQIGSYLEKCLLDKYIVGRIGNLVISFCSFYIYDFITGVVNNEFVFMFPIATRQFVYVDSVRVNKEDDTIIDVSLCINSRPSAVVLKINSLDYSLRED